MKSSSVKSTSSISARFYAQNQFIGPNRNLIRVISSENELAWERDLLENGLQEPDYNLLLKMPEWDLAFIPFFLSGLRVFHIYFPDDPEYRIEPRPGAKVTSLFFKLHHAITQGHLSVNSIGERIELSLHQTIRPQSNIFLEDLTTNRNRYPIKIQVPELINWALSNGVALPEPLLKTLSFNQKKDIIKNKNGTIISQTIPSLSAAEIDEITLLAAAQAVIFINPSITQSSLIKDPLFLRYGTRKVHTHTSKHLYGKVRAVDPRPPKKRRGRPRKAAQDAIYTHPPINHIFDSTNRLNLQAAKTAFLVFFQILTEIGIPLNSDEFWQHPLLQFYIQKSHPLLIQISRCWLQEWITDY